MNWTICLNDNRLQNVEFELDRRCLILIRQQKHRNEMQIFMERQIKKTDKLVHRKAF